MRQSCNIQNLAIFQFVLPNPRTCRIEEILAHASLRCWQKCTRIGKQKACTLLPPIESSLKPLRELYFGRFKQVSAELPQEFLPSIVVTHYEKVRLSIVPFAPPPP